MTCLKFIGNVNVEFKLNSRSTDKFNKCSMVKLEKLKGVACSRQIFPIGFS